VFGGNCENAEALEEKWGNHRWSLGLDGLCVYSSEKKPLTVAYKESQDYNKFYLNIETDPIYKMECNILLSI
jgi:hypothetical protein